MSMKTLALFAVAIALYRSDETQAVGTKSNVFAVKRDSWTDKSLNESLLAATTANLAACSASSTSAYINTVNVLLVFSRCTDNSLLTSVDAWARDMKRIVKDTVRRDVLNFQATMVPGACTATYGTAATTTSGTSPIGSAISTVTSTISGITSSKLPSSVQEVPASDLNRLRAFSGLGQVQSLSSCISTTSSQTAAISFATDAAAYNAIIAVQGAIKVSNTINFQTSSSTDSCSGRYDNCIDLKTDEDIFLYNPFTVTNILNCKNLAGGVPITLIGDDGKRQCFCGCPAGYEMQKKGTGQVCVQVQDSFSCVWRKVSGYRREVISKTSECSFDHIVDEWGIPMPLPTSAYESLLLADVSLDPRLSMSVVKVQDPEYSANSLSSLLGGTSKSWPLTFKDVVAKADRAAALSAVVPGGAGISMHNAAKTWKDYQSNRVDIVNNLGFSGFGKYRLELNAFDYSSSSKCTGCLAIVDGYRPRATTKCPSSFTDSISSNTASITLPTLTMDSMDKANGLIEQYSTFVDSVDNDACSINNRCDLRQFYKQNFFERKYTEYPHDQSSVCFNSKLVLGDLLNSARAKVNPLKGSDGRCLDVQTPVPVGQCSRCCKMTTALREYWTDYRCGSDYDVRYCDGDSTQTCTFEQCLVANGDTLATVTAQIKPSVVADSEKVMQSLNQTAYQTAKQIHRMLGCTSFYGDDGVCEHKAKLSDLVDTTQSLNFNGNYNTNDYVNWRFKLSGASKKWQLWKTRVKTSAETGCYGSRCVAMYENDDVLTFSDPETEILIEAWTQCGLVRNFVFYVDLHLTSSTDLCCQFGKMWYQTSASLTPVITQMCAYPESSFADLTFDFHPSAGFQYSHTALPVKVTEVVCNGSLGIRSPVQVFNLTKASPVGVTSFAVEMAHLPNTEALTNFGVSCDFKYVDYGGSIHSKTCGRAFSIVDCTSPEIDPPSCSYTACTNKKKAGLYEVCSGTVVKGTDTKTYVENGAKQCCQGCAGVATVCTGISTASDETIDLMRCEPSSTGGVYGDGYSYYFMFAQSIDDKSVAMVMLISGVIVAAVVFAVIRRRRESTSQTAQTDPENYYLLM
ncbi:hypothetical protein PHYBOEH_009706 [Phytophthora boehmeriae]|uniref:Cysteine-rich protein n=1 Tax=Phytophthora boehmeriae TaxID=109152 RepID=A0A8T1X409_9STRA|nr:hypothetical protein PHYBOEH_009706 [Phytophthora boehmeriae]